MIMSQFDDEYFLLQRSRDERLPFLQPTPDTAATNFRYEALQFGSKPLMFVNGIADLHKERGISPLRELPEILFSGTDLIVADRIRERLLTLQVPNLILQPSIYIDESNRWHENYWYMTFADRFDCWDRSTSDFEQDDPPIRLGGEELFDVYAFRLNEKLMRETPLDQRLLFKMGAVNPAPVIAHRSVASMLKPSENATLDLVRISDWQR